MKQITITVPDNCELEQNGNTYTVVEKEKKLTYDDVAKELFLFGGNHTYILSDGSITKVCTMAMNYCCPNNATSEKQAEKLFAINKLMNVAKYLNGDWQPNWDDEKESKFFIPYNYVNNEIKVDFDVIFQNNYVYFKSEELAKKAIEILGEETIKLALCTDY